MAVRASLPLAVWQEGANGPEGTGVGPPRGSIER